MDNELKVIRDAIKGDHQAFEQIVFAYEKKVYNIAYQMFGNSHDASDASQEVFIKIYQKLGQFKFDSAFSTWLHRLSVNTCIDLYRKKKRQTKDSFSIDKQIVTKESSVSFELIDKGKTPEETVLQNEQVKEVRKAIQSLKEEQKTIIILRDLQGFSYEEIADTLDCNIGTVKSRIARGRKALKEIIIQNREQNSS